MRPRRERPPPIGSRGVAGWPDHQQGGLAGWPTDFKSGCLRSGSYESAIMHVFHNVELRREPRPSGNKIIERQTPSSIGDGERGSRLQADYADLNRSTINILHKGLQPSPLTRRRFYFIMPIQVGWNFRKGQRQ